MQWSVKSPFPFLPLAATGFLLSAPSGHAALLAQYLFNNNLSSSSVASGVSAPVATTTGGAFVFSTNNIIEGTHTLAIVFSSIDSTAAPTTDTPALDYVTITLTPTAGQTLNLDSLNFTTNLNVNNVGTTAGASYTVQYDDLSDGAGFQLLTLSPATQQTTDVDVLRSLDLSGSAFDNLTAGITFRINVTKDPTLNAADVGNSARIDLLQFNGSVVPEPASAALLAAGMLSIGFRRRR